MFRLAHSQTNSLLAHIHRIQRLVSNKLEQIGIRIWKHTLHYYSMPILHFDQLFFFFFLPLLCDLLLFFATLFSKGDDSSPKNVRIRYGAPAQFQAMLVIVSCIWVHHYVLDRGFTTACFFLRRRLSENLAHTPTTFRKDPEDPSAVALKEPWQEKVRWVIGT